MREIFSRKKLHDEKSNQTSKKMKFSINGTIKHESELMGRMISELMRFFFSLRRIKKNVHKIVNQMSVDDKEMKQGKKTTTIESIYPLFAILQPLSPINFHQDVECAS